MKLGIIVLTNQQSGAAFNAVTNTIKDSYLGVTGQDRVQQMVDRVQKGDAEAKKIMSEIWSNIENQQKTAKSCVAIDSFTGTYTDAWFGDIVISNDNSKMRFNSKRSPRLRGDMLYYKANTFVVKWDDRSMDADAFLVFTLDSEGKAEGIKMNAISPLTDFSFDFQDLDFKRKKGN